MPLNISTNTAALLAGAQLSVNQTRLQRSFDRLRVEKHPPRLRIRAGWPCP